MSEFKSCPVCQEQSDQCLSCASYVVDGERIYYEKLKDFGATKDHEIRFINRIQKHRVTAFFHIRKLYIPSRQGRSVPLAIGLQWDAWQEQQAIIDNLKAQLNNMEACYIEKKKEVEDRLNQTKDVCDRYDRLYEEYRLLELLVGNYRVLAQEVLPRCSRELLENIEGWEKALRGAND